MRTWALAAVLLTTQGCRGGAALPASPEAGPGGGDATAGGADRPAADGPAASDGGATADAGGDNCFGQICPPGTVCCGGCAPGTGACYSGGCPGAACPPPPPDAGGAIDAQSCSDKAPACGPGLVCDLDQPGRCAASTAAGTCIVKPSICLAVLDPVCGCDGRTYGNDCARQVAGAQLDHRGACGGAGVACGSLTCTAGELCVHRCTCGGPAPSCNPPPDGGACPVGTTQCRTPGGAPGCARACMNPPPHCGAATECPTGMRDSTGQLICACPP